MALLTSHLVLNLRNVYHEDEYLGPEDEALASAFCPSPHYNRIVGNLGAPLRSIFLEEEEVNGTTASLSRRSLSNPSSDSQAVELVEW